MKKIMFNERYGLEQAVIAGTKTMTRRRIHFPGIDDEDVSKPVMGIDEKGRVYFTFDARTEDVDVYPKYQIVEQVAIAQPYKNDDVLSYNAIKEDGTAREDGFQRHKEMLGSNGYRNKMFVKAEYMPHRIRITNIKAERLQDISDEDCLKEGVEKWIDCYIVSGIMENQGKNNVCFDTPREAFAALIDRISGRGTWQSNPWVYAYTLELLK